jgi:hypothetical protein
MKKNILKETVDKIVKETVLEHKNNNKMDMIIENVIQKHIKMLKESEDDGNIKNKKKAVIQWLQKPEIDTAEIRRKLEGEPEDQSEEDSKRSYFMKKVNQSYGKDFSDDEINSLYSIKTGLGQ